MKYSLKNLALSVNNPKDMINKLFFLDNSVSFPI